MLEIISDNLWDQISSFATGAEEKKVAVAYISDDSIIKFGDNDTIIVNASDNAIKTGMTNLKVISSAIENGADVYSCDSLHAKVMLFDNVAIIGSANISKNSRFRLNEAGIVTNRPEIISGAIQLIEQLKTQSEVIDDAFLKRASKIKVKEANFAGTSKNKKKVTISEPRVWLVSVYNDAQYPGDEHKVEEFNDSLRITEKTSHPNWFWHADRDKLLSKKAKEGDILILIDRPQKSDEQPQYVYKHTVIKKIFQENDQTPKTFHYLLRENDKIVWSKFLEFSKQVDLRNLKSGLHTCREISFDKSQKISKLWEAYLAIN